MLVCRSLILAEIARCFQSSTSFRHNLKRTARYVSNERINSAESKEVVARRLVAQLHHRLQIKPKHYIEIIEVIYHKTKRYPMKVVLNCARIKGKVSSWLLATDLGLSARQLVNLYRRRFWCEESFRDQKQEFELEGVRVTKASRLENLLVALAIVLLILAVIGMRGNKLGYRDKYCTRKKEAESTVVGADSIEFTERIYEISKPAV